MKNTKSASKNTIFYLLTFALLMVMLPFYSTVHAQQAGWYFTSYSFKDGSLKKSSYLMGTSSKMNDVISYKGIKGNITITYNRYDDKTGKLLAGVTYAVTWTDPASVLVANQNSTLNYSLNTIASKTWTPAQNSVRLNQGLHGIYFKTPDGKNYFNKDFNATLVTEKLIAAGTKGAKRFIQVNLGNGFMFTYNYEWRDGTTAAIAPTADVPATANGWHYTSYKFTDGSSTKQSNLMGTSATMTDKISYKGVKGNITITQNRYDDKTGKLLAGVTYNVVWTDPEQVLAANQNSTVNYTLKTTATKTWKAPQQSVRLNQGMYGVYFRTPDGNNYVTKDMSATLTTEKVIAAGTKGAKRFIQVNLGNGYMFTYYYEWR